MIDVKRNNHILPLPDDDPPSASEQQHRAIIASITNPHTFYRLNDTWWEPWFNKQNCTKLRTTCKALGLPAPRVKSELVAILSRHFRDLVCFPDKRETK